MAFGAAAIWFAVVALSLYASRWKRHAISEDAASKVILWAGVAFPVAVLTGLLTYALWLMPSLRPFADNERARLHVDVTGSQFWWHVVYRDEGGEAVISANEIRLPANERIEFSLTSNDMIHSFWIPSLGGKMDLIPGRTNRISLRPTRQGVYRGQCAEFCGSSHALMAFPVVVMERGEFETWIEARRDPSAGTENNVDGRALFFREDCGSCHRVAGTRAQGSAGPDLSHIGSRLSIGAGLLDNNHESLARFIVHPGSLKSGSQMPASPHLAGVEAAGIATWLKGLE
jgi:cytochrome c oxidase subunit 2